MPGLKRLAVSLPSRFLRFFFFLIYQPLAWSYDLVAWSVSMGQWKTWIHTTLPLLDGPRVLELGHGPGHLQLTLNMKGVQTFGLDISPQMGRLAQHRLRKAGIETLLTQGKAQRLPFTNNYFDQIVSTFPSEYIVQAETLSEIKRLLHANGRLVVLPVAWIRNRQPLGRLAAWLFRVTGQSDSWDALFSEKFRSAGFIVEEKRVKLPGSELVLLIATTS